MKIPADRHKKKKTRIHHQHLRLGEERPGLHCKYVKNSEYNKIFFDSAFSEARMKPYFDRYPGNENISWSLVKLEELHSLLIQVIDWMNPKVTIWMKCGIGVWFQYTKKQKKENDFKAISRLKRKV